MLLGKLEAPGPALLVFPPGVSVYCQSRGKGLWKGIF